MKLRTIIIMYMVLMLSGCGNTAGWQTGNVTLVQTLGVDSTEMGVQLSAVAEGMAPLSAEGETVAAGMQQLRALGDGFLHVGHVNQLVLSEAFARDGVQSLLDFVARDRQIGPGVCLWILRSDTVKSGFGADASARLMRLAQDREGAAPKLDCTATRLMSVLAGQGSVPVPALRREGEELTADGYGILRQGRLVGFLNREQSLGLELLCGRGAGQVVEVALKDGTEVVLSVRRAKPESQPVIVDGVLTGMRLHCAVRLEPIQGSPLTQEQRLLTARQAETVLCGRMAAALACSQLWDADFAGLESAVKACCSAQEWEAGGWEVNFRTLALRVATEAEVNWPADMVEECGNES